MKALPDHAGPVGLDFLTSERLPRRLNVDGKDRLLLPKRTDMRFVRLKGGEQFVVAYPQENHPETPQVFFGGMDESAFITELYVQAWKAYLAGGERGFFNLLEPEAITKMKKIFPKAPIDRQGDIWYAPVPMTWSAIKPWWSPRKPHQRKRNMDSKATWIMHVLGTNHSLTGKYFATRHVILKGLFLERCALGEGILEASDHTARTLAGPHLLARTPYIKPAPRDNRWFGYE